MSTNYLNGHQQLPHYYDENTLVLLPRDPYWVFAYWEVSISSKNKTENNSGKSWPQISKALAFHRFNPSGKQVESTALFSINATSELKGSWYFQAGVPDRKYIVELGYFDEQNNFCKLQQSNEVQTPRDSLSDIIDERWRLPNWQARNLFWRTPLLSMDYTCRHTRKNSRLPRFKLSFKRKRLVGKEGN